MKGHPSYQDLMSGFTKLKLICSTDGTGTGSTNIVKCEAGNNMPEGSVSLSSIAAGLPALRFSAASTPTVKVVSPSTGTPGTIVTITGSNFAAPVNHVGSNWTVAVSIGHSNCVVNSHTSSQIQCKLGETTFSARCDIQLQDQYYEYLS